MKLLRRKTMQSWRGVTVNYHWAFPAKS
jgi:hypothetical protein